MTLDQALLECERLGIHPITGGYGAEAPAIIAAVGAAAAVAGAGVTAYAAHAQGQAQEEAADFNAKVAKNNAIAAEQAAAIEAEQKREHYRRLMGTQRARQGASGVEISSGSPLLVQLDQAEQAALALSTTQYGGGVRAQGFNAEAELEGFSGSQAARAGTLTAGASILTGVSSAAGAYSRRRPSSVPSSDSVRVSQ